MEIREPFQSVAGRHRLGGTNEAKKTKDFMILCPMVAENSGVIEALYSLYYLPPNFKLLISRIGVKSKELFERINEIMNTEAIVNRVLIQDETGTTETGSLFATAANAVVYGSSDPMYTKDAPQAIIVFDLASKLMSLDGQHNFAVASNNPESVASAILQVARNQR